MNVTPPPTTGLVAGKYQLVSMIGRGGMGSVWEARHASLGTRFAIKFIESEYADSQEARTRFDREARAAATLQSKHAIQIYDHGVTEDGKPYIVMELLVGEPLDKRIERMGRLPLQDTARILGQVCRALGRAHVAGIIHRDLKPENVFIVRSQEDDEEIAKVLDFGIAKMQDAPGGMTSSTKTGAVLGTPYYMSPEQARGLRNVDHRTDLWSLGVIAYRCVVGKLPFDGESVGDLLVKICTSPLPVPSASAPGIPASFDAWFQRALDREPERRFQSAQELADALAFAAGLSVRTGIPASQDAASRPPSYVGGAAYAASTPMSTPQPAAMTGSPFTTSAAPSGGGKWKVAVVVTALGALVAGGAITATAILKARAVEAKGSGLVAPPADPPPAPSASPAPQQPAVVVVASTPATTPTAEPAPPKHAVAAPTPKAAPPKPATKPPVVEKPTVTAAPPTTATPPPAPTTKKPKDVTGY